MIPSIFIFILSGIGIAETTYLISKRQKAEAPVCLINGDCAAVLNSKYNNIFFVPNDVLGLLFHVSTAFLSAFLMLGFGPLALWILILQISVGFGSLMSVFFTYLQWRVIREWCFWCLMSAVTVWLMGLLLLIA